MIDMTQMAKVAELKALLPSLSSRDQVFASSLVSQGEKYNLSPKQMYWVDKIISNSKAAPEVAAHIDNVSGIVALLNRPGERLKYPKIRFLVSLFGFDVQAQFKISIAGEKARYPGSINVVSNDVFYGRIHQDGRYEPARNVKAEDQTSIIAELKRLASDPEGVAREYGKRTGHCCFCGLPLDDERSVSAGFGETCSKNWGLHSVWKASVEKTA
jgi:hypothetical protein